MTESWLDQLEKKLESKLSEFLQDNPYQESLLQSQAHQELYSSLQSKKEKLQSKAKEQRKQLLALAIEVRNWKNREKRARDSNAEDLADKALIHLERLMQQGRELWSELGEMGQEFKEIQKQIQRISKSSQNHIPTTETNWSEFSAQEELDHLKQKLGLE